jgi:hypothetical protein
MLPDFMSQWLNGLASGKGQTMITVTGLTREVIIYLLNILAPAYDNYNYSLCIIDNEGYILRDIEQMGRPHTISPEDCLGLFLIWICRHGKIMVLQLIFAMTVSPLAKSLQYSRQIICK